MQEGIHLIGHPFRIVGPKALIDHLGKHDLVHGVR